MKSKHFLGRVLFVAFIALLLSYPFSSIVVATPVLTPSPELSPPAQLPSPFKAICLLVDFSDNSKQVLATFFDTLVFGVGPKTVRHYWNEVSYGTLDIVTVNLPSDIEWLRAPQSYAYYTAGQYGTGSYPQNAQKLVEDAIVAADPIVDFSQYDNDGDGYVDALMVVHAGPGAEMTHNPGHIWSHKWVTNTAVPVDEVLAYKYAIMPEYWLTPGDMTIGVYCHELGHIFGLPDLYDTDYSSAGIGRWCLMAAGSWNGVLGSSPAHLSAWCRIKLGFISPTLVVGIFESASIPAIENPNGKIYKLPTYKAPTEYFLVENRQAIGYDAYLPGFGLLIWHVDEAMPHNKWECLSHNNWLFPDQHYKVALEQADGLLNLEEMDNLGDDGDPYPGATNNRNFTFSTIPNSSSYYTSADTRVKVTNISNSALIMTANLATQTAPAQSVATATITGVAWFSSNSGNITNLTPVDEKTLPVVGKPPRVVFPHGFFSFNITNIIPGATVVVTITFPSPLPVGTQYWKYQAGIGWYQIPIVSHVDNVIIIQLKDGGLGDADRVANGTIVDPGGPGVFILPPPPPPPPPPAPPPPVMPAALFVSNFGLSPTQVQPNQPVAVSVNVTNAGGMLGAITLKLTINGVVEQTQSLTVSPRSTSQVTFTVYKTQPGTYHVAVDGQAGYFIVVRATSVGSPGLSSALIIGTALIFAALFLGLIALVLRRQV